MAVEVFELLMLLLIDGDELDDLDSLADLVNVTVEVWVFEETEVDVWLSLTK